MYDAIRFLPLAFALLLPGFRATDALAQGSFDVLVGAQGNLLTVGFYSHAGGNTSAGLALDYLSGQKLFRADFGDFAGGPRSTDDPGFQALPGTFLPGTLLQARGVGTLEYWSPVARSWGAAPGGEAVRLFGGVPTDVAIAYLFCQTAGSFLCDPGLAAQYPFYQQGTAFTASGVSGPNPAIIDESGSNGGLHAHLDWFLERINGTPTAGAYLVTLGLLAPGTGYLESEMFKVLFNYQLNATDYNSAVLSRIAAPVIVLPSGPIDLPPNIVLAVPVPGSALLLASGLFGLALFRRRFKT